MTTTARRVRFEPKRAATIPAAARATREAVEHVRSQPRTRSTAGGAL